MPKPSLNSFEAGESCWIEEWDMDVLLIGSTGGLMQKLIDKLDKEKNRIFVLTEESKDVQGYRKAFETYRFSYDNACIREVFASVKPDVTIFLGAFDYNFRWETEVNAPVKYTTALLNMLISFAANRKGRFVYLSSDAVFEGLSLKQDLDMQNDTDLRSKAQAIAMGEKTCMDYRAMVKSDVVVLRLGGLYGIPTRVEEIDNICAQLCMQAYDTGEITLKDGNSLVIEDTGSVTSLEQDRNYTIEMEKIYRPLFLPDAVEFIFQVSSAGTCKQALYQISGGEALKPDQIAGYICKEFAKKPGEREIAVAEDDGEAEDNVVLNTGFFEEEFSLRYFYPPRKAIPELAAYLKKNGSLFSKISDRRGDFRESIKRSFREIVKALVPFVENLVLFVPFFMLNNRAVGSAYFDRLDFYLLYVLLFAVVHGQQQAIFSSMLAIAGYCFRQMYDRSGFDVMLDYNTYVWMAQLLILGLVVGYMRDQLRSIREEHAGEIEFLTRQLSDLSDINGSNVRVKEVLSDNLINQSDSLGKIYEITSQLNAYQPVEVMFYAAEVLAKIMRSRDVAIYSVANRSYARLFSSTSVRARKLGNSINYTEMTQMYEALRERKVYINKEMRDSDPLMAYAIYGEEEIQMILMVWDIPWERMTLAQADMLAITGSLIRDAVLRADRYMSALEEQRYVQGTRILDTEAFELLVSTFLRARSRDLTSCALLTLDTSGLSSEEVNEKMSRLVRQSDYLGRAADGTLKILLANTDTAGAAFVQGRFRDQGFGCEIEEAMQSDA